MTTTKAQELAKVFAEAFVENTRNNGETFHSLKDGSPQWMTDAVRTAHDDIMPNDWIYKICSRIADHMASDTGWTNHDNWDSIGEWADGLVDVYNADRARWLASCLDFGAIVDEAVEELGHSDQGIYGDIAIGQYCLIERIATELIRSIEEQAELSELDEN